jgi:NADH dehydrogenase [ubiquinone] 1 alpha subcomplex assembly factor 3
MDVKGGVIINKKQIMEKKAKMEKERSTDLPMDNYRISEPTTIDSLKHVQIFRQTDTMHELSLKPNNSQVFAMDANRFMVNDVWFQGSVCLFPNQIFLWDVANAKDIRSHSFELVQFIKPRPRYVIIGTGKEKV